GDLANPLLHPRTFENSVRQEGATLRMDLAAGEIEFGSLEIGPSRNGFAVNYQARDMDRGQAVALEVSNTPPEQWAQRLASDSGVRVAIELGRETLVLLHDSNRWLHVAPESIPSAHVQGPWDGRVAGTNPGAQVLNMAWLSEAQIVPHLTRAGYSHLEVQMRGDQRVVIRANQRGPPAGGRAVEIRSVQELLSGTQEGNSLVFSLENLPPSLRHHPETLLQWFSRRQLRELASKVGEGGTGPISVTVE